MIFSLSVEMSMRPSFSFCVCNTLILYLWNSPISVAVTTYPRRSHLRRIDTELVLESGKPKSTVVAHAWPLVKTSEVLDNVMMDITC